jgi:hypothetical protein
MVGRYLKRWGLSPKKRLQRDFEQDLAAVRRWLPMECPATEAVVKHAGARIRWGDEMRLRSDHQTGTSTGRKPQRPVILGTGKLFFFNVLSAVTK